MSQSATDGGTPSGGGSQVHRISGYQLLEPLGAGGMSNVYRAVHRDSGAIVAVKVLPRSLARNATMLQRFLREARVAQTLIDPHIVEILDRGCEDGRYFIVLEYLPGGDLSERVRVNGPLRPHEAVAVVEQVARGLRHAAEQNLIHRDIKPANILIGPDGRAKIADLGLALRLEEEDVRVTRDGMTVGTVDYMAPEQARDSRACSVRSDIYSLGCTLYYLLTGEPPYPGGDVADKLRRHTFEPPPDPRRLNPAVPEPLARLTMRMMNKDPAQRFADYDQLLAALAALPRLAPSRVGEAIRDDTDAPGLISPRGPLGTTPRGAGNAAAVPPLPESISSARAASMEPESADSAEPGWLTGSDSRPWPVEPPHVQKDLSERQIRWLRLGLAAVVLAVAAVGARHLVQRIGWGDQPVPLAGRDENAGGRTDVTAGPAAAILDVPARPVAVESTEPPWTEPVTAPAAPRAQRAVDRDAWTALGLGDLEPPAATAPPTPIVVVRRLAADRTRYAQSSVRKGLDRLSGTVELADDGPFFQSDLRLSAGSAAPRRIAAAEGFRPMIVLDGGSGASGRGRTTAVALVDRRLELVGVDLVIDARSLDAQPLALFRVERGGSLLLRDCTVTVEAADGVAPRIALFEAGGMGQGVVTLDRTLVRVAGQVVPARLAEGGQLVAWDSFLLAPTQPLIELAGGAGERDRRAVWIGTTAVTGAGWVEGSDGQPLIWRAAGCTLVDLGQHEPTSQAGLDWKGIDNRFAGDDPPAGEVGPQWIELKNPPPMASLNAWASSEAVMAALGLPVETDAAQPRPGLREWTLSRFEQEPPQPPEPVAGPALEFDADDPAFQGDLGRFLAERAEGQAIRVRVHGAGQKWMTPIRLQPGTRLTIEVQQPLGSTDRPPLVWTPIEQAAADALISGRNVELILRGARFKRNAPPALRALIRIEQGRLAVEDSWLTAASEVEPGGGDLVVLVGEGTRPLSDGGAGPVAWIRRSVLVTGGTAVTARLGRGAVVVENCAVAAGRAAFDLEPADGASPDRFAADLRLDRCTIVAERDVVRLGPWSGPAAPERPWVVESHACAFLDPFNRGTAPSTVALLRADELALAQGVLIWQSDADGFDLGSLLAVGQEDPLPISFRDAGRGWSEFWGSAHVVHPRSASALVRLAGAPLEPGDYVADDLRLVPVAEGFSIDLGADADALGLAPASPVRRPPNRNRPAPRLDGPGMPARAP